jgi:50S ribosomal protein L16 3-hydroxylase
MSSPGDLTSLLAGLTPDLFLRRHWQKRPLLARSALPAAAGLLTREQLFRLARREDVESRLVTRFAGRWDVAHGPFTGRELARMPPRNWTLLVQGVNHVLPQADALLREFSFIPYARLDDLMVSYAPPGGGVGPHFDSYDVFLLQLAGSRRWRVSAQRNLALIEGAPLRLLQNFRASNEWRLAPGDMLYLPPRCAHDGIAVDHCLTASIGFRAPAAEELGGRFLEFLADHLSLSGIYTDPGLRATPHPGRIGDDLIMKSHRSLARIRWSRRSVLEFLGCYLTEPRPHVRFERPSRPVALSAFSRLAASRGLRLDLKTRMLYSGRLVFINGSSCAPGPQAAALLRHLADRRRLAPPAKFDAEAARSLYQCYRAGYIEIGAGHALRSDGPPGM